MPGLASAPCVGGWPCRDTTTKGRLSAARAGEGQGLVGEGRPVVFRLRVEAEPFLHRRALVRVEVLAVAAADQLAEPVRRKLEHQPSTDEHREDLGLVAQG